MTINRDSANSTGGSQNSIREIINSIPQNDYNTLPVAILDFLSADECDNVIELIRDLPEYDADVIRDVNLGVQYDKRKSQIKWIAPDENNHWLFLKLQKLITGCNERYQYDIQGFFEGIQVATYTDGGHFDWHMDAGPGARSLRKLAISVQLSDQDDYEGGELEFMGQEKLMPKNRGAAIIFPTFLFHRVRPVVKGTRIAIITWVHGHPFK